MAKIKEELHTSNTLTRRSVETAVDQKDQTVLLSEQAVYKENMATYSSSIREFERAYDREQILIMSREHQRVQFRGWLLGEMLRVKKTQIEQGESDFSSWNDMFVKHGSDLGFTRQAADNYLRLNANFTIEEYERLGTRVCLELTRIKDEEQRAKAKKAFSRNPDLTADAAKEAVTRIITKAAEETREVKEVEKKKILKSHPYSVDSAHRGKIDGNILVTVSPEDHAGMLSFLNTKEAEIKRYLESYDYKDETD